MRFRFLHHGRRSLFPPYRLPYRVQQRLASSMPTAWLVHSRKVTLQSPQGNTVLFHGEVKTGVVRAQARRHVCSASGTGPALLLP
jgi:hypothetical protein